MKINDHSDKKTANLIFKTGMGCIIPLRRMSDIIIIHHDDDEK